MEDKVPSSYTERMIIINILGVWQKQSGYPIYELGSNFCFMKFVRISKTDIHGRKISIVEMCVMHGYIATCT